jgi:hypothetical protein
MWFSSTGAEMSDAEWDSWFIRCLGMLLGGATIDVRDRRGRAIRDDTFLVLLNAHYEPVPFVLPGLRDVERELVMDTAREPSFVPSGEAYGSAALYDLRDRSAALLRLNAGIDARRWRTQVGAPPEGDRSISVVVEGTTVKLYGSVSSWAERDEAERAAWSAPGTTMVENHIIVNP